jgi:hypothetical protein
MCIIFLGRERQILITIISRLYELGHYLERIMPFYDSKTGCIVVKSRGVSTLPPLCRVNVCDSRIHIQ